MPYNCAHLFYKEADLSYMLARLSYKGPQYLWRAVVLCYCISRGLVFWQALLSRGGLTSHGREPATPLNQVVLRLLHTSDARCRERTSLRTLRPQAVHSTVSLALRTHCGNAFARTTCGNAFARTADVFFLLTTRGFWGTTRSEVFPLIRRTGFHNKSLINCANMLRR